MADLHVSFPDPCTAPWDEMRPQGCNRFCASCSKTIYDLSELTAGEAETLLRQPEGHCFRAQVSRNGHVLLKRNSAHGRRMMVAVGASIGLFASGCTVAPRPISPSGIITGKVDSAGVRSVTIKSQTGRSYRAKVTADGTYRFKPLPVGSYALKYHGDCGSWNGGTIILREDGLSLSETSDRHDCIIVGMAKIEGDLG